MNDYYPVSCREIVGEVIVGGVKGPRYCGGTVWVAEQLLVYGVHRFKKHDRKFDAQFPAGVRMKCALCGAIQQKRDLDQATA